MARRTGKKRSSGPARRRAGNPASGTGALVRTGVLAALAAIGLYRLIEPAPPSVPPTPSPAEAPGPLPDKMQAAKREPSTAPAEHPPKPQPAPDGERKEQEARIARAARQRVDELTHGRQEALSRLDPDPVKPGGNSPEVTVRTFPPDGSEPESTPSPAPGSEFPTESNPAPGTSRSEIPGRVTPRPAPFPPVVPIPGREVDRARTGRAEVALTFDAGSDYRPVPKILDALSGAGLRATFFLTGEWVRRYPQVARRIVAAGHELGNHSWDHPAFTGLTDGEIREQLERTEAIVRTTLGRSTRPYFRPPEGARDGRVLRAVGQEGYTTIYWTLDSHDSVVRGIRAEQIRDRVLGRVQSGSIVLLHCGSQPTADALPEILDGLRERGLEPVTVSRLLQR